MRSASTPKKFERDPEYKSLLEFFNTGDSKEEITLKSKKRRINRRYKNVVGVPHPFVKWAGGKRQLLTQFDEFIPKQFSTYLEPFLGGGAVYFYLLPETAVLIDNNAELINCYRVIKNQVEELIDSLKKHRNKKDYFYQLRNVDRNPEEFSRWSDVEKASRTIFLNRCCFNGLYRVNSKGQFNVPFGKYKNPKFCDEPNLRAVNKVLKGVRIIKGGFETCLDFAKHGDFLYMDPPYQPLSKTANFTGYTKDGFGEEAQRRLHEVYQKLDGRGCMVMLSNSYNEFILDLYGNYRILTVDAKRAINSDASKRGEIKEVLILNY